MEQLRFDWWGCWVEVRSPYEPHAWADDAPGRPPVPATEKEARALALSILGPPERYDSQGRRILECDEWGPVVVAKQTNVRVPIRERQK